MAENKKDSFTFSDKIKNSKPAFNPFSKRISSKIGNNGKPKKTLFERTRRDAPFFVAAAAALLMLPFLYKYSGSVEDGTIITPGADSVFEPERSGFDPSLEDPSAQIAQLSVRDPLSLIKGWGEPEEAPSVGSFDRDGMDDTYTPPARSYRPQNNYRQQAPAQTRASFNRQAPAPTKVNKLGSSGLNFRGGGGGFGRFGGANLKTAAKTSSAPAPKQGVKPVSLQPLRAAGNPSRSYFGQGSAAQARASRDAMGKANALQALSDAMYDPLKANHHPFGGLGSGDAFGMGGAGKWDPHSEYKGITPWWWDLMKKRDQMEWELWFNLKKKALESLVDMGLKFADGFLSCLMTATDDWSMGSMFGYKAGSGDPDECIDYTAETWPEALKTKYGPFSKAACRAFALESGQKDKDAWWSDGDYKDSSRGFFGARAECLGGIGWGMGKFGNPDLKEANNCARFNPGLWNYSAEFTGKASRNSWEKYFYIVARNYVPSLKKDGYDKKAYLLCNHTDKGATTFGGKSSSGVGFALVESTETVKTTGDRFRGQYRNKRSDRRKWSKATGGNLYKDYANEGITQEEEDSACVIYVEKTKHGIFNYLDFLKEMTKTNGRLYKMAAKYPDLLCETPEQDTAACAKGLFDKLDLYFIESASMQQKLASGQDGLPQMPMMFSDFENTYLTFKRVRGDRDITDDNGVTQEKQEDGTVKEKKKAKKSNVHNRKLRLDTRTKRKENKIVIGARCFFKKEVSLTCEENTNKAHLSYLVPSAQGDIKVQAEYTSYDGVSSEDGKSRTARASSHSQTVTPDKDGNLVFRNINLVAGSQVGYSRANGDSGDVSDSDGLPPGMITWRAYRGGEIVATDTCDYNNGGSEIPVVQPDPTPTCQDGETKSINVVVNGQNCPATKTCADNKWSDPVMNDPECGKTTEKVVTVVGFRGNISGILGDDPLAVDPRLNEGSDDTACKISEIGKRKLMAIDNDISGFLKLAQKTFNEANEGNNVVLNYQEEDITVANLLDAMSIVGSNIPLNAVCMLGKTIGANSIDGEGNNMFGSFAAFMGPDSSFFPTFKIRKEGQVIKDGRFLGCIDGLGTRNKAFHYGHYNWNHKQLGDQAAQRDREPFEGVLARGPWKNFPLKPIADAVGFERNTQWDASEGAISSDDSMDRQNRKKYHDAYKNVFQSDGSCGLTGAMSYEGVKDYVQTLCQNSADIKPSNGSSLNCNFRYKADNRAY